MRQYAFPASAYHWHTQGLRYRGLLTCQTSMFRSFTWKSLLARSVLRRLISWKTSGYLLLSNGTRPDIAYAAGVLVRFNNCAGEAQWTVVEHIHCMWVLHPGHGLLPGTSWRSWAANQALGMDDQSAICVAKNPEHQGQMKHLHTIYRKVHNCSNASHHTHASPITLLWLEDYAWVVSCNEWSVALHCWEQPGAFPGNFEIPGHWHYRWSSN